MDSQKLLDMNLRRNRAVIWHVCNAAFLKLFEFHGQWIKFSPYSVMIMMMTHIVV